MDQSAFYGIFCKRDELLLIPVIPNRISLIWIRVNKHWGKKTILVILWSLMRWRLLRKQDETKRHSVMQWNGNLLGDFVIKCLEMLYLVYMTLRWTKHSLPLLIFSYVINLVMKLSKLHLSHNQIVIKVIGCDSLL